MINKLIPMILQLMSEQYDHAEAIFWPRSRIRVHGINPSFSGNSTPCGRPTKTRLTVAGMELAHVLINEEENARKPFQADPYGTMMPLHQKRLNRGWNPDVQMNICRGLCPGGAIQRLVVWNLEDGGQLFFDTPEELPWFGDRLAQTELLE